MTATQTITELDVAQKVLELADANPDFIYQRVEGECLYVNRDSEGNPLSGSCIFGQALLALGVDPESIPEGDGIYKTLADIRIARSETFGIILQEAMRNAQYMQDQGYPWGEAVGLLRQELRERVGK